MIQEASGVDRPVVVDGEGTGGVRGLSPNVVTSVITYLL